MGTSVINILRSVFGARLLTNEPMKNHTSWRIGGEAQYFIEPQNIEELRRALAVATELELPVTVIGNGTNLLVKDTGIRGLVIKVARGLNNISVQGTNLIAGAGALLPQVAQQAMKNGLAGFAWCAGIPGTVGGAVVMNAGANGSSISDIIVSCRVVDRQGNIIQLTRDQMGFSYRASALQQRDWVVVETSFALRPGDPLQIKSEMDQYLARRKTMQPQGYPNAGSVFKNPPHMAAGQLIESAGCKGLRVGNAQVSAVHANWIVNLGGATAQDVLDLIEKIREEVERKFGVSLQLEVRVLG